MKSKIALAQTNACEKAGSNAQKAEQLIREAAEKECALVVFPEIYLSAFSDGASLKDKRKAAMGLDGEAVCRIRRAATENNIWVIFGMYSPAPGDLKGRNLNRTVIVDGKGNIAGIYDKTHLYDAFSYKESDYNAAGDKLFEPIDTPIGKVGLMVCYELRFPEVARYQTLKGADIIIVPTAWFDGKGKAEQLRILTTARAIENTVYVAMCDMCGDGRVGESVVLDPLGRTLVKAGRGEELLICDIDTEKIKKVREMVPSLAGRRPELYKY